MFVALCSSRLMNSFKSSGLDLAVFWLFFYCCEETTWPRQLIKMKHLIGGLFTVSDD